jgi:glycosyltransferase involved in cell wall biosynthesis
MIRSLQTISEQDYPKNRYEVIVVDNGSKDDTEGRVKRWAEGAPLNVSYLKEPRPGLVFARHSGAATGRGEILVFGDDDALYEANWLSAIVDVYRRFPEAGAVGTAIEIKWDTAPEPWVKQYEGYLGQLCFPSNPTAERGLFINGGSFSVRKSVLYSVRGFNPGQRGEYIVGDSETGLCRKLAAAGIPVGVTGATTAWHMQFAKKHGSYPDLRRRFRNNGICLAYGDTFHGKKWWLPLAGVIGEAIRIARLAASQLVRKRTINSGFDAQLRANELYFRLKFLFLYRFHHGIRGEIFRKDWELTNAYSAPVAEVLGDGVPPAEQRILGRAAPVNSC